MRLVVELPDSITDLLKGLAVKHDADIVNHGQFNVADLICLMDYGVVTRGNQHYYLTPIGKLIYEALEQG